MADEFVHLDDQPDDEVAQLLRGALRAEADQVVPHDRFAELLDRIEQVESDEAPARGGRLRWLSIAAVAALAFGVALPLLLGQFRNNAPPATTVTPVVTVTESASGSPSGTPSSQGSLPTTQRRVAVYYIGADDLLYREFRDLPTQSDRLTTSVAAVLNLAPLDPSYASLWSGGQVNSATLSGSRIVIDLSSSAFGEFADEATMRQAINQVVYTAIAAVGDRTGEKTVQILIDGSPQLPLIGTPSVDFVRDGNAPLAPLWVTIPETGQALPTGTVSLSGYQQTTVADTKLHYTVTRQGSSTSVSEGDLTAAGDEAGWRSWQVQVTLEPGDYTFTVRQAAGGELVVKTFKVTG